MRHLLLEEEIDRPPVSGGPPRAAPALTLEVRLPGAAARRRQALQRAVRSGVERRALLLRRAPARADAAQSERSDGGVVRPLPRREFASAEAGAPPVMPAPRPLVLEAATPATLRRAALWLRLFLAYALSNLRDGVAGRQGSERRAQRLRELFAAAGGTAVKLGQLLAVRIDMLPFEYCRELAKLRDVVAPMPTADAVAEVERATRRPLAESFAAFDPEPIVSTSLACTYQAVLKTGEKVAVKVRRPGITDTFAAELRALSWFVAAAEAVALFRPGYVRNVMQELRATLAEELDLRMEASYQAIFRREARRGRLARDGRITAPRVFFALSSSEVLVQEFIPGIWLWEVLAAVEQRDPVALARMAELRIDAKRLARRIQRASLWGQLGCPIYHANPHSANVLVQEGHKLVFIDFGSCGSTNRAKRAILRDLIDCQARRDIQGVVRSMLSFMEPLPPIDLNEFEKKVELVIGQVFHKVWSGHAPWYERSSAALFLRFFEAARQYNLPVNMDTVRSFRASMLYDILALRIDPTLDVQRENRRFNEELQHDRRRGMLRRLKRRLSGGLLAGRELMALDELTDVASRGLKAMRQELDRPRFNFVPMVEKPVFAVLEAVRLAAIAAVLSGLWLAAAALLQKAQGGAPGLAAASAAVTANGWFWASLGLVTMVSLRRVLLRFRDMKV